MFLKQILASLFGATLLMPALGFFFQPQRPRLDIAEWNACGDFTKNLLVQLRLKHPRKNVMIYHDKKSQWIHKPSTSEFTYEHHEFELPNYPGHRTQGYEAVIFDEGIFKLHGDQGYVNWCYGGRYNNNDHLTVTFLPIPKDFLKDMKANNKLAAAPITPSTPPEIPNRVDAKSYFVSCHKGTGSDVWEGTAHYRNHRWEGPGIAPTRFSRNATAEVEWSFVGGAAAEEHNNMTSVGFAVHGSEFLWAYEDQGQLLYEVDGWKCFSKFWAQ